MLQKSDQLEIITVNEDIEKRAWVIFKKYQDQPFSYTDCTSFAVMERHKLKTAFAFDTHFEIFGFKIHGLVKSPISPPLVGGD